jgi:hypothetical protein
MLSIGRAGRKMAEWQGCRFFAHKRGGKIMVVSRTPRMNGVCFEGFTVPTAAPEEIPVATWVDPALHGKRYVEVSEEKARELHPMIFQVLDLHERSAAYRAAHGRYQGALLKSDVRHTGHGKLSEILGE